MWVSDVLKKRGKAKRWRHNEPLENEWEKARGRKGGAGEKVIQTPAVILLCQTWLIKKQ